MISQGIRHALLAATMLVSPAMASAEAAAGADSVANSSSDVEEIVVTAERRSQNLLSVPLSISAVSGDQLAAHGTKSLTDLQFTTPGYLPTESAGYDQIFIRGIGNAIFFGADPSVATFIDDVPRIYGSMNNNLVDVERIEVIKGAPGGLYGRNATGGAINIITHQPSTDKVWVNAKVSYGEKSTLQAAAAINLPIGDKVALLLTGERDSHAPYIKNDTRNSSPYTAAMFPGGSVVGNAQQTADFLNSGVHPLKGYANANFWAGGAKLLLKPSDNFKITLAGDYNRKNDSLGTQGYNLTPAVAQADLVGTLNAVLGTNAQLPAGFIQGANGKFTTSLGVAAFVDLKDYGTSATAVLNLPGVDITSISAYRRQRHENIADLPEATVPNAFVHGVVQKKYFYQELRAVSTSDGPFRWTAGATYLRNEFHSNIRVNLLPPLVVDSNLSQAGDLVHAWSAYAQADYDVFQALTITVSGRYIHEANTGSYSDPAAPSSRSVEKKFLPSATLSYKLDGGGTAYARWARGFKSGGVNPISPPNVFPNPALGGTFKGETVDTYEIGYRAPLFDRKVQVTAALFYNDYRDLQTQGNANAAHSATIILAIVNANKARTYGAEGSLTWRVIEPLTLGMSAGYLNAKYKDFKITDTSVYVPVNLDGQRMFDAPKIQLDFTADLDQPVTPDFRLVGNATVSHISRVIWGLSGNPGVVPQPAQPGYWITNVRLGIRTTDDKYGISVFANNLFDKGYSVAGSSNATTGTTLFWGNPRIIGAEATVKF